MRGSSSAVSRHGLHGGSWATAELASATICSGPAAHMTARSMARAESNDAVPSSGTWSNDAASTIAAQRCAAAGCPVNAATQPASTASGGYPSTADVAQRREPPLDGRHLAGAVGRQHQLGHQLGASVALRGVQQVLEGQRRRSVRLVPVGGPQVQLHDRVGLDASQLTEQELAVQRVVAVPLAPAIERDEERVRRLEAAQPLLAAGLAEYASHSGAHSWSSTAVRRRNRCIRFGQQHQRLAVQVVGDVAVVSGDRQLWPRSSGRSSPRGTDPTGQPSVRSVTAPPFRGRRRRGLRRRTARRRPTSRARSPAPSSTHRPPRAAEADGAARTDSPRPVVTPRYARDRDAQRVMPGRRCSSCRSSTISTNGSGLDLNADASRGAARPKRPIHRPPMSATRSAFPARLARRPTPAG